MIPINDQFERRHCEPCGFAHFFDSDNPKVCCFAFMKADAALRERLGIPADMTPNKHALVKVLKELPCTW